MSQSNQRIVDITCTVKASVAAGRQLMKNLDTGEEFWTATDEVEVPVKTLKSAKGKKAK